MIAKNRLEQEPHIRAAEEMYKIVAIMHPECIVSHHKIEEVSRIDVPGKALDIESTERLADIIANRHGVKAKLMINFVRGWNSSIIFGKNLKK